MICVPTSIWQCPWRWFSFRTRHLVLTVNCVVICHSHLNMLSRGKNGLHSYRILIFPPWIPYSYINAHRTWHMNRSERRLHTTQELCTRFVLSCDLSYIHFSHVPSDLAQTYRCPSARAVVSHELMNNWHDNFDDNSKIDVSLCFLYRRHRINRNAYVKWHVLLSVNRVEPTLDMFLSVV